MSRPALQRNAVGRNVKWQESERPHGKYSRDSQPGSWLGLGCSEYPALMFGPIARASAGATMTGGQASASDFQLRALGAQLSSELHSEPGRHAASFAFLWYLQ